LTDAAIADAEERLGVRLPAVYLDALREQNGGYLRWSWRELGGNELWGIGPRWPSLLDGSLAKRHPEGEGWLPRGAERLIPFAGDGHWYLCFDVRAGQTEPAIAYVDLECEHERPAAGTFAELAGGLGPDPEEDRAVGLTTGMGLEAAAGRLGKALRMKVTDQGDRDHGYRTFHGAAKRRGTMSQFWMTPNEVPRGFVRTDHEEYAALAGLLPGTALRYPEHPDCALIVAVSQVAVDELMAACARAELPARQL
jgi:hypothetical protein